MVKTAVLAAPTLGPSPAPAGKSRAELAHPDSGPRHSQRGLTRAAPAPTQAGHTSPLHPALGSQPCPACPLWWVPGPVLLLDQFSPVPFYLTAPSAAIPVPLSPKRPRDGAQGWVQASKVQTPTGVPLWRPAGEGEGALAVATGSSRGDGVGKGVALGKQWLPLAGLVGCCTCAPCSEKQQWSWLRLPGD